MPVETARKHDDEAVVIAGAGTGRKELGINMIDERGRPALGAGALGVAVEPEVIGNDHVVGEGGREALDGKKQPGQATGGGSSELAVEEFGQQVVDIEQNGGFSPFRIPSGEDEEIRHIVNMQQIVRPFLMACGQVASAGPEKTQHRLQVSPFTTPALSEAVADAAKEYSISFLFAGQSD